MRRLRIMIVLVLAVVCLAAAAHVRPSAATFTTSSQTDVTATTDSATGWLHLYSQTTDPAHFTAYATQRVQTGIGAPCATGTDRTLGLVMGGVRSSGTSYRFNRAFTMTTASPFPDAAVTQVTIAATYVADPSTGLQPMRDCRFSATNTTGGSASVTVGANTQYQANIRMRMQGTGWVVGRVYYPTLRLTLSWTGGPAGYYVYDIPLSVTATSW